MDYTVTFTDSAKPGFIIKPYTANGPSTPGQGSFYPNAVAANTSLVLLGQGDIDYGQIIARDLVSLLENFAAPTAPIYAIQGQLWYNDTTNIISVYTGTVWNTIENSTNKTTDGTLGGISPSNILYPSEQAVKTYADTKAPLASPALVGVPTAPTALTGTNTTQIATTAFVLTEISTLVTGVSSFNTRTGAVTLTSSDVTTALTYTPANLISPSFTGIPVAPTASPLNDSTQIATTAYVDSAVTAGVNGAVTSFNTRTGAVTLTSSDVTTALTYTPPNPLSVAITGGTIDGTPIGSTTPASGSFTAISSTGLVVASELMSTVATGTPPLFVSSTTNVANLNASSVNGYILPEPINTQIGTSYTLALTDAGSKVETNNASSNTVYIPLNSSVVFPINTSLTIINYGAGLTTITGDVGVTVNGVSGGSVAFVAQYQGKNLYQRATDKWVVY